MRYVLDALRDLPYLTATVVMRWLIKRHWPEPTNTDDPANVCWTCKDFPDWPCAEFLRLDAELDQMERGR